MCGPFWATNSCPSVLENISELFHWWHLLQFFFPLFFLGKILVICLFDIPDGALILFPFLLPFLYHSQNESESSSVMSDSLQPQTIQSMNSPGQNTGVGSLSFLQGIFAIQGSNLGLPHCRWILYQLSHQGSPRILKWVPIPSPVDLPDPRIKLGSPAFQADSLPAEL